MPVMRGMGQIGQRMRHAVRAQFPGLYDGMRTAVWQFGSLDRVVSYRLAREARVPTATLVDELRREGIVVRDVGEIFIPGDPLFTAVNDYGHDMWREVSGRQGREGEQALEAFLTNKRKEFRVHLLPELGIGHRLQGDLEAVAGVGDRAVVVGRHALGLALGWPQRCGEVAATGAQ